MRIVRITTETDAALGAKPEGVTWELRAKERNNMAAQIVGELNAPIEHTRVEKISHDTKTDRYVATFRTDNRTATLKVTNEVAAFIAEHQGDAGYWRLRMNAENGAVEDCYLVVVG